MGKDNYDEICDLENKIDDAACVQWHLIDDMYWLAKPTVKDLPPGFYNVFNTINGITYQAQELNVKGIFPTGSPNAAEIIDDFHKFWASEKLFRMYKTPFKRGVLLSGPPGSGKTCIIKLLIKELVDKYSGVALDMRGEPEFISDAVKSIHMIHTDMPILIIMEDIDHYYHAAQKAILNTMDGMCVIDRVMFIATTNNVNELPKALIDRPGRIDAHFQINPVNIEIRENFIAGLIPEEDHGKISVKDWARDTKNLPFGHIKELVISVMVLGKDYKKTLERIKRIELGQEETEEDSGAESFVF